MDWSGEDSTALRAAVCNFAHFCHFSLQKDQKRLRLELYTPVPIKQVSRSKGKRSVDSTLGSKEQEKPPRRSEKAGVRRFSSTWWHTRPISLLDVLFPRRDIQHKKAS